MKKRGGFEVMARLIGLVKPLSGYMILAILAGFLGHLFATLITVSGAYAVLKLLHFDLPLSLTHVFIGIGSFALLRGVLRYAEQTCNHYIAFKLLALIRDQVFCALRKLCPAKLEGRDKGNLVTLISSDVELLEFFYAHTISPIAIAILFTLTMCAFIATYHIALGLLALVAYLTVGILIPAFIAKASGRYGDQFRAKSGAMSSFVLDSLRGLSEIIQFGQGQKRLAEMNRKTDDLAGDEERMKRVTGRNFAISGMIIFVFDLAMLFVGAWLYQSGQLGFDGVLISTIALMSSFGPVLALAGLGSTLQNTLAAGNRVLDILEENPLVEDISGEAVLHFDGAAAEKVHFAYDDEVILEDLSLDIAKNAVIGISGRSGSGKSTLLKLFMRFWEAQRGCIKVSGREVNQINTPNLRDMESFVTQETHLFHDSIKNNLRVAKLDATDEEIEKACKKASVHDFIMSLPKAYDTPVGELGDQLSGGERQRLGLARAFLHDAPFMLLDEPTSNLDSLNEAIILKSLAEERSGKTVLLVSHRESTMRIADSVYSVERGSMS